MYSDYMNKLYETEKAMLMARASTAPFGVGYSQQIKEPPSVGLVDVSSFREKVKSAALTKLESLVDSTEWQVMNSDDNAIQVAQDKFVIQSYNDSTYLYHNDVHIGTYTEQLANDLDPHANIVRKILLDAMDRHIKEIEQGV